MNNSVSKNKKDIFLSFLSILLVSVFPVVFLYSQNADIIAFTEVFPPSLLFFVIGLVSSILSFFYLKSLSKSVILSILFMLIFSNYIYIEKVVHLIFGNIKYWHLIPILLVILLHIAYFFKHKLTENIANDISKVLFIVFAILTLINIVFSIPKIIEYNRATDIIEKKENKSIQAISNNDMPNVYYCVFDEYSGFEAIDKIYGYDNKKFEDFLNTSGFNISRDSYNDSSATVVVMNNILNLDYIYNDDNIPKKPKPNKDIELYNVFRNHGYNIKGVGSTPEFSLPNVDGEISIENKTIDGDNFSELVYKNTMLYHWLNKTVYLERAETVLNAFDYMMDENNIPKQPTFTFFYLISPHAPFLFREDGSVSSAGYTDWEDPEYYLGQFKYITKKITEMLNTILKEDPNSIIILQSDHAARYPSFVTEPLTFKDKTNILNCVYFGGEKLEEIQSQTGLNTILITLNKLFGDNTYKVLEVPEHD